MNPLEVAIRRGQAGVASSDEVLRVFAASSVFVPSVVEVGTDLSALQPLFFDEAGPPMMGVFSSPAKVGWYAERAPYGVQIQGAAILRMLAPGIGLVVNAGQRWGFAIPPEDVPQINAAYGDDATLPPQG